MINRIGFFLLTLLLPLTGFAVDPNNLDVSILKQGLFTPPLTDRSMAYLGQVFGSVGSVLHGGGAQLLASVFVVFNLGIWVLAGCYVLYTTLTSVMNAAHEGEFMGKKMHSMVPVRVVAGVAMLLPKFSGYSFIQLVVMWAVVQGVGLADNVWNSAIDYFKSGGVVSQRISSSAQLSYDLGSNGSGGIYDTLKSMTDLLNAQICMYSLQNAAASKPVPAGGNPPPVSQGYWTNPGVSVTFGNDTNQSLCGAFSYTAKDGTDITPAVEAARIDLAPIAYSIANQQQTVKPDVCLKGVVQQGSYCLESNALVSAMSDYLSVMTMIQPRRNIASSDTAASFSSAKSEGWILAGKYYQEMANANINSISHQLIANPDYYSITIATSPPYQVTSPQSAVLSPDLTTALGSASNVNNLKTALTTTEGSITDSSQLGYYGQAKQIAAVLYKPVAQCNDVNAHSQNLNEFIMHNTGVHDYEGDNSTESNCAIRRQIADLANKHLTQQVTWGSGNNVIDQDVFNLMQSPVNAWFDTVLNTDDVTYADPVARARMLGLKMIAAANKFWSDATSDVFMVLGVSAGVTTATLIGMAILLGSLDTAPPRGTRGANALSALSTSLQLAFQIIMARVFWYLPLGIALSTPIFVLGATLAVYVPLIPFMLFMFAALGWFITVLEAMVAAPLVALGVTHPEGHDLLGKAEQSIMLILGVFLKPVLLVTGLLAGIILTFIAADLLDKGFFHLIYGQLTAIDSPSGGTQFVVIIAMLVIYTMALMAIVDQCFSLIHVLPDKTLRWIGGHPEQSAEGGMLQQVKSGYEGKVGEGAQAGGQQVSAVKSSGITAQAPPQMQKKEAGKATLSGGDKGGDAKPAQGAPPNGGPPGGGPGTDAPNSSSSVQSDGK